VGLNVTLIPLAQQRYGNGGVGAAAAAAIAEVVLVASSLVLLPTGTLHLGFLREAARVLAGAAAMAAVKLAIGDAPVFVGIPLAVAAYIATLAVLGGVRWAEVADLRASLFSARPGRT